MYAERRGCSFRLLKYAYVPETETYESWKERKAERG